MPTADTLTLQAGLDPSVSGIWLSRRECNQHPRCCKREAASDSRRILCSRWLDFHIIVIVRVDTVLIVLILGTGGHLGEQSQSFIERILEYVELAICVDMNVLVISDRLHVNYE